MTPKDRLSKLLDNFPEQIEEIIDDMKLFAQNNEYHHLHALIKKINIKTDEINSVIKLIDKK